MNKRIGMSILTLIVVGGLALGCDAGLPATLTPGAPTPPAAYPAPAPPPSLPPPSSTPGAEVPAGAEAAVALARADLARRLSLKAAADIAVVSVETVDWPSTALGCPQPGMMYAQVITPGYRIVLAVEGQHYEYHTDMGRQVVLCAKSALMGKTPAPTVDLANPPAQRAAAAARADLAQRLGVDPASIAVVEVRADDFPAQNLGCWPPGTPTAGPVQPAFVTGLEIVLSVGGQEYVYRAHGGQVVFCGPW